MGYYIQTPKDKNKAQQIIDLYNAELFKTPLEDVYCDDFPPPDGKAFICVIENPRFDAAAFCYDRREFEAFALDLTGRRKTWLLMDWDKACELSGYKKN